MFSIRFNVNASLFVLFYCLASFCCSSQNRSSLIDSFFSKTNPAPLNGGLLMVEKGGVIYRKSFGMADFANGHYNTSNTGFNLASVSKVITSTAILQLMEKRKLRLEDPLQKYFPKFPYPGITIRHLLTHTSGLPDLELYEDLVRRYPDTVVTNNCIIQSLAAWKKPLPFSPGDKWRYCNTNYDLLALVIEKVSGISYANYLKRNIFSPSGMTASFISTDPRKEKGATAYVLPNWFTQQYIPADSVARFRYINYNLGGLYGSTNIITTLEDMLLFDKAVFSGKLLRKETLILATTPVILNDGSTFYEGSMDTMLGEGKGSYGMGWSLFEQPGLGRSVGHGGYNYGLFTFYLHHLEPAQTIIAFDNTAGSAFAKAVTSAVYLLNGRKGIDLANKASLARTVGSSFKQKGINEAVVLFNQLRYDTAHYYLSEREWNWMGYDFLRAEFDGHMDIAMEVFKINTLLFPQSFNVYDSYAEALQRIGKKNLAIEMYEKSLSINPDNEGAKNAIKLLKQ